MPRLTTPRAPTDAVSAACSALTAAELGVSEAQRARDEASEALDEALARVGWRRVNGAFSPGTRLYANRVYPDATLPLTEVLAHLEERRAAV
jgi:hypothetical protein